MEDVELDAKYKTYSTQIEKVLKQFESPREWADLCSYLTKLKRILQNNAKYQLIPKKLLVAKRLSQCLHHALPSGVHLKTLEVYILIFKRIGMERLSRDLSIYSMGLFPLLGHSAMSVKPKLLDIFDTFYIPLGSNLVPCLHGFILCLLSGLEEGSEHFESIAALLGKLKMATGKTLFYGSFWRSLISAPSVRYQGSLYVLTQITKHKRVGRAIFGDNRQTLVTSLCLGLHDTNVLTQRNFLDFILFACPLNSVEFARADILKLLQAALSVLLRRDMSLNRRVYNWLEGHGAHERNEKKRISMTSQELQSIVQEDGYPSGEEHYGTPSEQMPKTLRKHGQTNVSHISVSNGSPYENIRVPEIIAAEQLPEQPPPVEMYTTQDHVTGDNVFLENGELSQDGETDDSKQDEITPEYETVFEFEGVKKRDVIPEDRVEQTPDTSMSQTQIDEIRADFFLKFGRPCMMQCLRDLLNVESTDKALLMQPYRIINSLMDRQDFGSAILEDILVDINRALYKNCVDSGICISATHTSQLKLFNTTIAKELIKAANMLINTFEPHLLWDWLCGQFTASNEGEVKLAKNMIFTHSPAPGFDELLSLTDFLLEIVSFEYNASVQSTYLPQVLQRICEYLLGHVRELESGVLAHAIETSSNLLSRAQPTTISPGPLFRTPEPPVGDKADEPSLEMDEISAVYDLEQEEVSVPSVPSQDYVSKAIVVYQEFLSKLIEERIIAVYGSKEATTTDIVAMFLPACRLLLDFACFPIFCNMKNEEYSQPLLLTDSNPDKTEEGVQLPSWLVSLLECSKLLAWEEVVLSDIKTLSVLIGLTLSIAEEHGAGRKTIEGSVAVVLMPMLSELQLNYIQSQTTYYTDIISSLWGYLAAKYAHLHHRVVKLLWKLHHLAPSSDIVENVMGEMLSSSVLTNRLEGIRRYTVFWHISAKLSDNCKEWSKLQVSGKDLSRTTLVLLESLTGPDYQSRLLAKAWISQSFHYKDINRIFDPLLIQLLHPGSARKLATPVCAEGAPPSELPEDDDDAHSLNTRTKMSVFSDASSATEYNTAESSDEYEPKPEERQRTDCQNELYYSQEYDTNRSNYIWQIMSAMLDADPTPFLRSCYSTKFNATSKYLSQEVYELFHKHRMSIRNELFGDPFFLTSMSEKDPNIDTRLSVADRLRKISKSYLELLVTVCLWYIRSEYQRQTVSQCIFESNCEVRLVAVNFLSLLLRKCAESPVELRTAITDILFERCHVQECILYVLQRSIVAHTEAAYIVQEDVEVLEWTKSFQSELLVLTQHILELEKCVGWGGGASSTPLRSYEFDYKYVNYYMNCQDTHITKVSLVNPGEETSNNPKYMQNRPMIGQPLFIHCVLVALTTRRVTFLHRMWLDTLYSCLNYKSPLIKRLSELGVQQVLHNISQLCREYNSVRDPNPVVGCVPVNQVVLLLEALTSLVHFILVNAPSVQSTNTQQSKPGFLELFSFTSEDTASSTHNNAMEHINEAKHGMLQYIPKCFDTLLDVWIQWKMTDSEKTGNLFSWGQPHEVKNLVLNFASPLFRKFPASMLSSLCEVWHTNRRNLIFGRPGNLVSVASKKQLALIDFMMDVKVCTFDVVLKNSQKLLATATSHPKDSREQFGFAFEVELVHLTYEYFKHLKNTQMQKAWPHLLNLLRQTCDIPNNPPVTLLSLGFVQLHLTRCSHNNDMKSRRELQEVTSKLIELTTDIASRSLSGNSWFGRKAEVLPVYNEIISIKKDTDGSEDVTSDEENYEGEQVFTLQAIYVLNECLAQLIDLVYGSEEKDKAITMLSPLLSKISVYVRNHAHHNMPNAKASAALLSCITDYQYCRKAWAKDLFDALMDPDFFIIDPTSLPQWKIIIEHLIAHDNLLFTDLLTRVNTSAGGLFGSNEVFYTQKARLLRRLTFTIYCCEYNQYSKYISKLQECFVEALKMTQAYQVIREVFLGFRVIILRMSPGTFTPLWPIMLNELYGNLVEFKELLQRNKKSEMSPKVLNMYLSVCKLLDLALILPASKIPDFQVHNWTFVSDRVGGIPDEGVFTCLSSEIAAHFDETLEDYDIIRHVNAPALTMSHISEVGELQPFFTSLSRSGLFGTEYRVTDAVSTQLLEEYLDQEYLDLH